MGGRGAGAGDGDGPGGGAGGAGVDPQAGRLGLQHLVAAPAEVQQDAQLGVAEVVVEALHGPLQGRVEGADALGRIRRQAHDHPAPVGRVGLPADVAVPLQAVDHPGHGPGGEAGQLGQAPGGDRPGPAQEVERLQVGVVDPQAPGHRLPVQHPLGAGPALLHLQGLQEAGAAGRRLRPRCRRPRPH